MNHNKLHAISLAVQWIRKALDLLLAVLADDRLLTVETLQQNSRKNALEQIIACQFKTNDVVILVSGRRSGRVQINAASIDLDTREFLILKALVASQDSLRRGAFVSMETILSHIEQHREEAGLADRWRYPVPEDVRRAVMTFRIKIQKVGGNPNLIESGKRGDGYRISSPHVDVFHCSPPLKVEP